MHSCNGENEKNYENFAAHLKSEQISLFSTKLQRKESNENTNAEKSHVIVSDTQTVKDAIKVDSLGVISAATQRTYLSPKQCIAKPETGLYKKAWTTVCEIVEYYRELGRMLAAYRINDYFIFNRPLVDVQM